MIPAELDLEIVRGVTFGELTLTVFDQDELVVDLTGWSVWAEAKECTNGLILDLEPEITDSSGGIVKMGFTDEETELLKLGSYLYDVIFENSLGARLGVFLKGNLTISDSITNP